MSDFDYPGNNYISGTRDRASFIANLWIQVSGPYLNSKLRKDKVNVSTDGKEVETEILFWFQLLCVHAVSRNFWIYLRAG